MLCPIASRIMARTTIDLDPSILGELRRRGAREHKSMGTVASELIAQALAGSGRRPAPAPLHWTSRDLGTPRVALEDKEALRSTLAERS